MRILRVLWARRLIIFTGTLGCALGGLAVIATSPPRYEATAKVELQIVMPDPVTGFFVTSKNVDAYVSSQVQTIRDFQVGVRVARDLGWLDSPDLQTVYATEPPGEGQDFEHWVAQRVTAAVSASLVEGSNILEIKYRAASPEIALLVVDKVRSGYIEAVTAGKRETAERSAARYQTLAEEAKAKLGTMQNDKLSVEQKTNVLLQQNGMDVESARLSGMATRRAPVVMPDQQQSASSSRLKLNEIESILASASQQMGPNNPQLVALRQRRDLLASQVALERSAASVYAGDILRGRAQLSAGGLAQQMSKVISQRTDLTGLRLMQDQIDVQRDRYTDTTKAAAQQKQLANVGDGGVTPVGLPEGSKKPAFPNKPLILLGSMGLGLMLSGLVALLIELFGRRVRAEQDLQLAVGGVNLTVLPKLRLAGPKRARRRLPNPLRLFRRRAVKA